MTAKKVESIIKADGWYRTNSVGGHRQYEHPMKKGKVTIPFGGNPKDLKIGTLRKIFRQAQLDVHDYM